MSKGGYRGEKRKRKQIRVTSKRETRQKEGRKGDRVRKNRHKISKEQITGEFRGGK